MRDRLLTLVAPPETPSNAQQRTPDKCVEAVTVGWRGETGQQVFDRLENTPPGAYNSTLHHIIALPHGL